MKHFNNKILFVGFGAVAQCTLPLLIKHIRLPLSAITILDFEDRRVYLEKWIAQGLNFVRERINKENLDVLLTKYLSPGDMLIDLAWNIDCCEILQWCHDNRVLYINTSVELWDPYAAIEQHPTERTLYWRHMKIRAMQNNWTIKAPTAIIEHGANPGLISHFTKQALLDIAHQLVEDKKVSDKDAEMLGYYRETKQFNYLAQKLGVKVIHCSERDTQITDVPKQVNEFVNTWSVEGFREEGTTTAEIGWGTHEKHLPALALEHEDGPKNQLCLARMGINTWVVSWVPDYTIHGMVVRHGESFTLSDHLTVWENDKAIYRPTVNYAYCPCDSAIASLNELRGYNYKLVKQQRILNNEITKGSDILGALVMGHAYNSWWTGSDLSIEESRKLVPGQNATTVQVAISVIAAALWMIENPEQGIVVPDDLPHDYILNIARPYLGTWISRSVDWTPLQSRRSYFAGFDKPDLDTQDPWQFKNFLISCQD